MHFAWATENIIDYVVGLKLRPNFLSVLARTRDVIELGYLKPYKNFLANRLTILTIAGRFCINVLSQMINSFLLIVEGLWPALQQYMWGTDNRVFKA